MLRWNSDGWLDAADAAAYTLLGAALTAWYMYPARHRYLDFTCNPDLPLQLAAKGAIMGAILGGGAYLAVYALVRAIARMPTDCRQ